MLSDDRRQQCISRRHRPYFTELAMAAAADDDDTSSVGTDNSGYENDPATSSNSALPSPESRQLPAQVELQRDASVFAGGGDPRPWPRGRVRGRGASAERPGLARLVSDMSDASNSTTSTFMPATPSQSGSGLELTERS